MEFPKFKHVVNQSGESLLPHKPPFLFVDTLVAVDETGAIGEYTYTTEKNDFFRGHFPTNPVVPGVILVESMAQVAGAAVISRGVLGSDASFAMVAVEEARFRQPFHPGDKLVTVVECIREHKPLGIYRCRGYLNGEADAKGQPAAECLVKCMMGGWQPPNKRGAAE